jgi:hypothetical protein
MQWPIRLNLPSFFDVDVNHLTRVFALIAPDRLGRLQRRKPVEAQPPQDPADGHRRYTDLDGDQLDGVALPAQRLDCCARGRRDLAWQ